MTTSWAVIDSGIMLATALIEPYSKEAKALVKSLTGRQIQIAAPVLFRYEIVAVLRKHVYRGTLTAEEATNQCNLLLAQPVHAMVDDALLRRGYELASQFNRPTTYDSQYLAVAERLGCEFWTADQKLYNALKMHLSWVKWLGSFTEPAEAE